MPSPSSFGFDGDAILIDATVSVTARTGVEMEALTAVAIAGLTLHDMVKAVDPRAVLGEIRLLEKSGGKHGEWTRDGGSAASRSRRSQSRRRRGSCRASCWSRRRRAAAGTREDTTGPLIVEWLRARGFDVGDAIVAADADVAAALTAIVLAAPDVVITTGGTGLHPQDRTPEATAALVDFELPGIARGHPRGRSRSRSDRFAQPGGGGHGGRTR